LWGYGKRRLYLSCSP
jgi:Domain of unknown function (DUF1934).